MDIFQTIQRKRKPSSITVTTSAVRPTSQTIKPTSPSMMSQDPHGNKDHADLKDNNQSNIGVVNYLNTMKEMGLKPQKQVKE